MSAAGGAAKVVVWLTSGGIVEFISDGNVEVEVIDFQNLAGGDCAPEFSPEMKAMLLNKVPDLLSDLEEYRAKFECGDCGREFWDQGTLRPIKDIHQRVAAGEPMPAGECPECGALVHVVSAESTS